MQVSRPYPWGHEWPDDPKSMGRESSYIALGSQDLDLVGLSKHTCERTGAPVHT